MDFELRVRPIPNVWSPHPEWSFMGYTRRMKGIFGKLEGIWRSHGLLLVVPQLLAGKLHSQMVVLGHHDEKFNQTIKDQR